MQDVSQAITRSALFALLKPASPPTLNSSGICSPLHAAQLTISERSWQRLRQNTVSTKARKRHKYPSICIDDYVGLRETAARLARQRPGRTEGHLPMGGKQKQHAAEADMSSRVYASHSCNQPAPLSPPASAKLPPGNVETFVVEASFLSLLRLRPAARLQVSLERVAGTGFIRWIPFDRVPGHALVL